MVDVTGGSEASSLIGQIVTLADLLTYLGITSPSSAETEIATASLKKAEGAVFRLLQYNPVMAVQTEYYPQIDFSSSGDAKIWEVDSTQAHIRRLAGTVSEELQVKRLPIREFDELGANGIDLRVDYDGRSGTRSGSFSTDTLQVVGTDFWPNYDMEDSNGYKVAGDGIIRSQGSWPSIANSVKIVYVAGYTATEFAGEDLSIDASPIRESVMDEAVRKFKSAWSRRKDRTGHGTGALTSENLGDYSYSADGTIIGSLMGSGADVLASTADRLEPFINFGGMIAL
jgi:hypothetical protein